MNWKAQLSTWTMRKCMVTFKMNRLSCFEVCTWNEKKFLHGQIFPLQVSLYLLPDNPWLDRCATCHTVHQINYYSDMMWFYVYVNKYILQVFHFCNLHHWKKVRFFPWNTQAVSIIMNADKGLENNTHISALLSQCLKAYHYYYCCCYSCNY